MLFGLPDTFATGEAGLLALLADGFILVSPWKPILLIVPFVAWSWIISKVLDKHAARFHLPREVWNVVHLCVGLVAFAVAVLMPMSGHIAFFAGLAAAIVLLILDIVVFAAVTNRDDRVPDHLKLRLSLDAVREARAAKAEKKEAGRAELALKGPKGTLPVPDAETPAFEARTAAEQIYIKAIEMRAARADVGPAGREGTYATTYVVDGLRQVGDAMPAADAIRVIDVWKAAAGLDLEDRRRRLRGTVKVDREGNSHEVWITTLGTTAGMRMNMQIDPKVQIDRSVEDLGLLEPQREELDAIVADARGIVLLASPAMGGRTTTMYTVLRQHDAYTRNIQTIETEMQIELEGVRQNVWKPTSDGPDHATTVRSILRRDPDVVGVANLTDEMTAQECAAADHDRTRVYISLPATGAEPAIQKWMKAIGDNDTGAASLHGVVAQILVRKLCENCRVAYQPSPEMLQKLGLPAGRVKQLFKKSGQVLVKNRPETCPLCNGTGYFGQTGVFEVFRMTPEDQAILKTGNMSALRAELRKRRLPTIQQAAIAKAVEGVTSIEEIMRVTSGGKQGGDAARPASGQAKGQAQPA